MHACAQMSAMIDANADTRRACRACVARLMMLETAVGQFLLAAMTPTSRKLFDVETNAKHTTDVFAAAESNSSDDSENTDDNVRRDLDCICRRSCGSWMTGLGPCCAHAMSCRLLPPSLWAA